MSPFERVPKSGTASNSRHSRVNKTLLITIAVRHVCRCWCWRRSPSTWHALRRCLPVSRTASTHRTRPACSRAQSCRTRLRSSPGPCTALIRCWPRPPCPGYRRSSPGRSCPCPVRQCWCRRRCTRPSWPPGRRCPIRRVYKRARLSLPLLPVWACGPDRHSTGPNPLVRWLRVQNV